jgi:ATP-dependent Lon protease
MFIATSNNRCYSAGFERSYGNYKKCQATQSKKSRDCKATFVSRQLKEHGLTAKDLTIEKKQLEKIVEGYTP